MVKAMWRGKLQDWCAGCSALIESPENHVGWIMGKPYCFKCLQPKRLGLGHRGPHVEEASPWQENAIRELEDAG